MIPGTLIQNSIGLCTHERSWWELWTDIITRAPPYVHWEDVSEMPHIGEAVGVFAVFLGLDAQQVERAFARAPMEYLSFKGYGDWDAVRIVPEGYATVRREHGPFPRWPVRARGVGSEAVLTDYCFARESPLNCDGSCAT